VFDGKASLYELETHWSLDDVARANALLDAQHAHEEAVRQQEELERKNRRGSRGT